MPWEREKNSGGQGARQGVWCINWVLRVMMTGLLGLMISGRLMASSQKASSEPHQNNQEVESGWQQEVHYTIRAQWNDSLHLILGWMHLTYINWSPDTLHELYFLAYPNAFRDNSTDFAKECMRTGGVDYLFAPPERRGYLVGLRFQRGKDTLSYTWVAPDIVKVWLSVPLLPGDTLHLQTPFRTKLPYVFSRMGVAKGTVIAAYWYPRVARYDHRGWHLHSYLDQGEFAGEFGTYKVQLTVPENFVVLATGKLYTRSEYQFRQTRLAYTQRLMAILDSLREYKAMKAYHTLLDSLKEIPPSSSTMKTITFYAERVHDFMWAADKRWLLMHDTVHLGGGRVVELWTAFYPEHYLVWRRALGFLDSALRFFSVQVGLYPYPQATVIEGPLGVGGGMEFPMISLISSGITEEEALNQVIAHEVGHNWFMGILAFEERFHPWMDEGINSFYEWKYMMWWRNQQRQQGEKKERGRTLWIGGLPVLRWRDQAPGIQPRYLQAYLAYLALWAQAQRGFYQPPGLPAESYTELNYGLSVYFGTPLFLQVLESEVPNWDSLVRAFYRRWRFRYPYPSDFQVHLMPYGEEWFFQGVLNTPELPDYWIVDVNWKEPIQIGNQAFYEVVLQCWSSYCPPFVLTGWKGDSLVRMVRYPAWPEDALDPHRRTFMVYFPAGDYDRIRLNPPIDVLYPEGSRRGDVYRLRSLFRQTRFPRLRLVAAFSTDERVGIGVLPWVSWTHHEGTWLGLAVQNVVPDFPRMEFTLVGGWGVKSRLPVGYGRLGVYFYPGRKKPLVVPVRHPGRLRLHYVWLGVEGKRFSYLNLPGVRATSYFHRVMPMVVATWVPRDWRQPYIAKVRVQAHWLEKQRLLPVLQGGESSGMPEYRYDALALWVYRVQVEGARTSRYNPWSVRLWGETSQGYIKVGAVLQGNFTYDDEGNLLGIRLYGGGMPFFNWLEPPLVDARPRLGPWFGLHDYLFEYAYLGRYIFSDVWYLRQMYLVEGGFRVPIGIGASTRWVWTLSFLCDFPGKMPAQLYLNFGMFYDDFLERPSPLLHELGISVRLLKRSPFVEVNIPLVVHHFLDENIQQNFPLEKETPFTRILNRITFTFHITPNIWESLRDFR